MYASKINTQVKVLHLSSFGTGVQGFRWGQGYFFLHIGPTFMASIKIVEVYHIENMKIIGK
jgi:hypothetical protein